MKRQKIDPYLPPAIQNELENSILVETVVKALGWEVNYVEYRSGWVYEVARCIDPVTKMKWRIGASTIDQRHDPPRFEPLHILDHAYMLLMQAKEQGWFRNVFIQGYGSYVDLTWSCALDDPDDYEFCYPTLSKAIFKALLAAAKKRGD
jgi:hypothetical protein